MSHWRMTSLAMDDYAVLSGLPFGSVSGPPAVPAFYRGSLVLAGTPVQTFLLTPGWGRGVVLVNGFNLGRFTDLGPQCSSAWRAARA